MWVSMRIPGVLRPIVVLTGMTLLLGACGSPEAGANPGASSPTPAASSSTGCSPTPVLETPGQSPTPSEVARPTPSPAPPPKAPARSIRVVLSKQHLSANAAQKIIVSTNVTTGRPELPTPTGHFHILAKYSPYRFVSPWPPGSPYYYAPVWVDYAMVFAPNGYFIHDAAWQRNFGPGGNLRTGSHGCINVPPAAMGPLYKWARVGDDVIITNS